MLNLLCMSDFITGGKPNGAFSKEHLILCFITWGIVILLLIFLKLFYKRNPRTILKISAIVMLTVEISKYILLIALKNWSGLVGDALPLYICSLILFALPIGAFNNGRLGAAMRDFVVTFGFIGFVFGTFFSTSVNYYSVFSFHVFNSFITHAISGFCAVYILLTKQADFQLKNSVFGLIFLFIFSVIAYVVNICGDKYYTNYMFLASCDGTPFEIVLKMAGGNKIIYAILVIFLQMLLLFLIYVVVAIIRKILSKTKRCANEHI